MWVEVEHVLKGAAHIHVPTALGHRGGPTAKGKVEIHDVVDDMERQLDALGLDTPHIVGNSMGGWLALDLARRGRAKSVLALSPAGMWEDSSEGVRAKRLRRSLMMGRITRPILPASYALKPIRAFAFRDLAAHPGSIPRRKALALTDDMLGCTAADDLLETNEKCEAFSELPCPVKVIWSAKDRIFPEHEFGPVAKERLPGALYEVAPNVGHVPMLDNPHLVADQIAIWLTP